MKPLKHGVRRLVAVRTHGNIIVSVPLREYAASTMTRFPTQSHYPHFERTDLADMVQRNQSKLTYLKAQSYQTGSYYVLQNGVRMDRMLL